MQGALINKVLNPLGGVAALWLADLSALFVPRRCAACDDTLMRFEEVLCLPCLRDLPLNRFHDDAMNRVERLFHGKLELHAASALLAFSPGGKVQRVLHRLKYNGDLETGHFLGRLMGEAMQASPRFADADLLLPVPLHPAKERARGYNQSAVLIEGIRQRWPAPQASSKLIRLVHTASQTRRGRLERWQNVKAAFHLPDPAALSGRHVVLIDDVVTTGATLEGCALALREVPGLRLSVFTAASA
jgi:ComF family protein